MRVIDPTGIPVIAGNMDALHGHADTIAAAGTEFADTGADLHSVWQGLATCYVAPESEQLLSATGPIRDAAATIGEDWHACAAALHVYADATAAVQVRLADIRARAEIFVAAHTAEDLAADEGLRDAEAGLLAEVAAAMAEWDAAQRECANAISALHGGEMLRADDGDGVLTDGEFGYSAAQYTATTAADGAGAPWGRSTTPDRGIGGDIAAFFGGIGDAAVGGVVELGALFGRDPATGEWSPVTAGAAWEGLGTFGLAMMAEVHPVLDVMDQTGLLLVLDRGALAQARDAAGKSLIAYDQWDDDPARAAGTVTGNVLMAIVGTKGAGAGLSAAGRGAATVAPRVGAGIQNAGAAIARMPTIEDLAIRAKGRLPAFGGPRYGPPPPDGPALPDSSAPLSGAKIPQPHVTAAIHGDRQARSALSGQHPDPRSGSVAEALDQRHTSQTVDQPDGTHDTSDGTPATTPDLDRTHGDRDQLNSDPAETEGVRATPPAVADVPNPLSEHLGKQRDGSWTHIEHGERFDLTPEQNAAADRFLTDARSAEPRITPHITAVAESIGGARLQGYPEFTLKSETSLKRKLAAAFAEDPARSAAGTLDTIKDSVRYTIELPRRYTDGVVDGTRWMLNAGFENVSFKPTWADPNAYKGVNSTWRDPVTGHVFELQFHSPESFTAKMDTHELFEAKRVATTDSARDAASAAQAEIFRQVHPPEGALVRLEQLREEVAATRRNRSSADPTSLDDRPV